MLFRSRKNGEILLFEGFMDVIAAWQAGIKTGLASMGTSLTAQQIQQMRSEERRVGKECRSRWSPYH